MGITGVRCRRETFFGVGANSSQPRRCDKSLAVTDQAMGIRFSNGNANRVTAINFLSSLWSLIDNQSGLKC